MFVPGNDYKAFLRSHLGENEFHRGEIYDVDGNFVAEHGGIELFTIGQRKGLPGGSLRPRYVVDLDPATNRVIVGDADDLVCEEFEIDRVNWHPVRSATPATALSRRGSSDSFEATVKIRYNHPGDGCDSDAVGKQSRPNSTARAAARRHSGSSRGNLRWRRCIGGGWICRPHPASS